MTTPEQNYRPLYLDEVIQEGDQCKHLASTAWSPCIASTGKTPKEWPEFVFRRPIPADAEPKGEEDSQSLNGARQFHCHSCGSVTLHFDGKCTKCLERKLEEVWTQMKASARHQELNSLREENVSLRAQLAESEKKREEAKERVSMLESLIRDRHETYKFGGEVMNGIVLKQVDKMLPGEIAINALYRWVSERDDFEQRAEKAERERDEAIGERDKLKAFWIHVKDMAIGMDNTLGKAAGVERHPEADAPEADGDSRNQPSRNENATRPCESKPATFGNTSGSAAALPFNNVQVCGVCGGLFCVSGSGSFGGRPCGCQTPTPSSNGGSFIAEINPKADIENTIVSLKKRAERAESERDRLQAELEAIKNASGQFEPHHNFKTVIDGIHRMRNKIGEFTHQITSLQAELAKCREALKPFEAAHRRLIPYVSNLNESGFVWGSMADIAAISYKDLRQAKAALEGGM